MQEPWGIEVLFRGLHLNHKYVERSVSIQVYWKVPRTVNSPLMYQDIKNESLLWTLLQMECVLLFYERFKQTMVQWNTIIIIYVLIWNVIDKQAQHLTLHSLKEKKQY